MGKNSIDKIIRDVINEHYGYGRKQFITDFVECLYPLITNLICIKMYPESQAIHHWRDQIRAHTQPILRSNITVNNCNSYEYRKKYLETGLKEFMGSKKSDLLTTFHKIYLFYKNKDKNVRLLPYASYDVCYEENKNYIIEAVNFIIEFIANQDEEGLINYAFNVF